MAYLLGDHSKLKNPALVILHPSANLPSLRALYKFS